MPDINLIERVHRLRTDSPLLPTAQAVRIVRYQERGSERYPFLNEMSHYPYPGDGPLTGEIDGITITVELKYDEDSRLGDDDVTGQFIDEYEDGCIKNTTHGENGSDRKWYRPSNSRMSDEGGWQWYWKHNGMAKSVARDYNAVLIKEDMREDADRMYLLMHVTLEVDDREIADNWLGGIDVGSDPGDSRSYLIETAEGQIRECFLEAKGNIDKKIKRAQEQIVSLRQARKVLKKGGKR